MKPTILLFLKKYSISLVVPLTLIFGSLFFLLLTPNVTRLASAATCNYSFTNNQTAGASFSVTVNGIAGDFYTAAIINTTNNSVVSQNTGQNAAGSTVNISLTAPTSTTTSYAILANGSSIINGTYSCTSANTTLTVTSGGGGGGGACTYSFPPSVAAGSTFNVTITGTAGHQFQAGIVNSTLQAVGGNGASVLPMSGSWNLSVTSPNPPTGSPFQLLAGDNTIGGVAGLCAPTSGSTAISIAGSTGGGGGGSGGPPPTGADLGAPAQFSGILNVIQNIIKFLAPAAAIAFLFMFIWGGFKFLTSGGDPKSAAGARSTLQYAIIGVILVVVSWLLLLLVQFITGVNVTSVSLPT